MKLIENKYEGDNGIIYSRIPGSPADDRIKKETGYRFLGQAESEISQPKKEVEKVTATYGTEIMNSRHTELKVFVKDPLPYNAYDIELHYKIKE